MIINITSIELRSPLQFFVLSYQGLQIYKQLDSNTPCLAKKNTGFWTMHYTLTAWHNEADMKTFARSGAHAEAMKLSTKLAKEIRILTQEMDEIPDWKTAKQLVAAHGRVLSF